VPEAVAAAVVVIVATAVTTKYVAVRAKNVARILGLIAVALMKLVVKAPVVVRAGSVVQEVIAARTIIYVVTGLVATLTNVKYVWTAIALLSVRQIFVKLIVKTLGTEDFTLNMHGTLLQEIWRT